MLSLAHVSLLTGCRAASLLRYYTEGDVTAILGAERFVQEIETTANLQHPHILPPFDSGEADGFLYYVMPFIDGETVRDKLSAP